MKLSIQSLRSGGIGVAASCLLSPIALADAGGESSSVALQPIPITILKSSPKIAPGLIFLTPTAADSTGVQGGQIVDGEGRPFSEIDQNNNLLFDAELPSGYNGYRAYRFEWVGEPDTRPTVTAQRTAGGDGIVHAIWNGATEVARWHVVQAGERGDRLRLCIVERSRHHDPDRRLHRIYLRHRARSRRP
jgi:hypothetical protein